jgi:hypothetical protein
VRVLTAPIVRFAPVSVAAALLCGCPTTSGTAIARPTVTA